MQKQVVLTISLLFSVFSQSQAQTLETYVETTSQEILGFIRSHETEFSKNPIVTKQALAMRLEKIVDFERITRGVMGKFYLGVSEDQKRLFKVEFRQSVVDLFAVTILAIKGESLMVRPLNEVPSGKVSIVMDVQTEDGQKFELAYSMLEKGDNWYVGNMIVNGLNLGLVYRNQFKAQMKQYGNDVNKVIEHWESDINLGD